MGGARRMTASGASKARVRLVHWNADEAAERAERLKAVGYQVDHEPLSADVLDAIRNEQPAAIVIDLSRLPSQGRDVGVMLRQRKATRGIPLVFVDGAAGKVERVKRTLPDAVFTTWDRIRGGLKRAITHPPREPVSPSSNLAGYSGTPLPKKLGIKANYAVALPGAPSGFEAQLGSLPEGVVLRRQLRGRCDLIIWFARSRSELTRRVKHMGRRAGSGGLWIAWPKQASGVASDLTQAEVRREGLAAGLVDYKVAAIDETWSGLKFARRKSK